MPADNDFVLVARTRAGIVACRGAVSYLQPIRAWGYAENDGKKMCDRRSEKLADLQFASRFRFDTFSNARRINAGKINAGKINAGKINAGKINAAEN